MLVLHQFEISPFCDKIRRVLHVKGVEYEVREVPLARAFGAVRKINPAGKLPCLEHDGRFVSDSTDIAYYLESEFPDPPLVPKDRAERALCHIFEDWADESLYFYEMRLRFTLPHNARRWIPRLVHADGALVRALAPRFLPGMMRRLTRQQGVGRKTVDRVLADVERHALALDDWLADREWLVGNAVSLADLAVFAQLDCVRGSQEGAEILAEATHVASWMERVDEVSGPAGR
jgi:glutathione S-transferase